MTLSITFGELSTRLIRPALMATTAVLIGSVSSCCAPRASSYHADRILVLQPGQTHTATTAETWHSDTRYRLLEQELLNTIATLKQRENK